MEINKTSPALKQTVSKSDDENNRLCNSFSNYFVGKINNLKMAVTNRDSPVECPPDPPYFGPVLDTLTPVTPEEVCRILSSLPQKSSSVDFLLTPMIKSCSSLFSFLIATLANLCFKQGTFPDSFKSAVVTPLLKKSGTDTDDPANYRPISNLINFSKILEKLFLARLQPHVLHSPNFNKHQSAYRPHRSTETALLVTLDSIYRSSDEGKPTTLISLDFSAAFDMIEHGILLSRLQTSFGITGIALKFIKSYLQGRTQSVRSGRASGVARVSGARGKTVIWRPLPHCHGRTF